MVTAPPPALLPAAKICGASVVDGAGEGLGAIIDLMIDTATGAISYAVLSYGGLLGVGETLFAVPWTCFRMDAEGNRLVLDVPRDQLDAMDGFDKDAWPVAPDPIWAELAGRQKI